MSDEFLATKDKKAWHEIRDLEVRLHRWTFFSGENQVIGWRHRSSLAGFTSFASIRRCHQQVRLVPLERDKFEGWRMKEELGFWKIQHRICLGGNATCEKSQTTSPSNDHSFKVVFFLGEAFCGCYDYHFCCAVLWSLKMSCKVAFETTNVSVADATGGVSLGYMSEAQVDLEAEGAEESHQSMCWVEIMEIPLSSSPDIRRGGWKMKHRMSCR